MLESLGLALKVSLHHWTVWKKSFLSNMSMTVSDPIFFTLAFGVGLGAYVSEIDGRSYIHFMAPGLAAGSALITSFFESSYAVYIRLNFGGTYKGMLTSPIGIREILMGELMWVAMKGAFMSTGVSFMFGLLGYIEWPYWIFVPIAGAMIGVSCGALGLLATTFVKNMDQFQLIYSVLIAPIYFLSATFFPVTKEMGAIYYIAHISPLFHGVRMTQNFLWNENIAEAFYYHLPILILQAALLGFWASKRFSKKLHLI